MLLHIASKPSVHVVIAGQPQGPHPQRFGYREPFEQPGDRAAGETPIHHAGTIQAAHRAFDLNKPPHETEYDRLNSRLGEHAGALDGRYLQDCLDFLKHPDVPIGSKHELAFKLFEYGKRLPAASEGKKIVSAFANSTIFVYHESDLAGKSELITQLGCSAAKHHFELSPQASETVLTHGLQYLQTQRRSRRMYPDTFTMLTSIACDAKVRPSVEQCEQIRGYLHALLQASDVQLDSKMQAAIHVAKMKNCALSRDDTGFLYDALLYILDKHSWNAAEKATHIVSIFDSLAARNHTLDEAQSRLLLEHTLAISHDQMLPVNSQARVICSARSAALEQPGPLHPASIDGDQGRELFHRSIELAMDRQTAPKLSFLLMDHLVTADKSDLTSLSDEQALHLVETGFRLLSNDRALHPDDVARTIVTLTRISHNCEVNYYPRAQELLSRQSFALLGNSNVGESKKSRLVLALLQCNAGGRLPLSSEQITTLKMYTADSIALVEHDLKLRKLTLQRLEQLNRHQPA